MKLRAWQRHLLLLVIAGGGFAAIVVGGSVWQSYAIPVIVDPIKYRDEHHLFQAARDLPTGVTESQAGGMECDLNQTTWDDFMVEVNKRPLLRSLLVKGDSINWHPEQLEPFEYLEWILVDTKGHCDLAGLEKLKSLKSIEAYRTSFVSSDLAWLGDSPELVYLLFHNCILDQECFAELGKCRHLKLLAFEKSERIDLSGLGHFKDCPIAKLRLDRLDQAALNGIVQIGSLEDIQVPYRIPEVPPEELVKLRVLRKLKILDLCIPWESVRDQVKQGLPGVYVGCVDG